MLSFILTAACYLRQITIRSTSIVFLLSIFNIGSAYAAIPVLEYHFDELNWIGTANEVIDNSGVLNGTAVGNSAIITPGQVCRAGTFDGTGDYIDVSGIDSYLSTTASISFWMKSSQIGNNTAWSAPGIIGVEQSGGTSDIFWGYLDASGHIRIQKGNGSPAESSTLVNDNSWHHVVLTWDSLSGVVQVFVDGNLEDSANSSTGDVSTAFSSIGRIENSNSSANFNGQLDELLIFDSVISPGDVSSIYTNQLSGNSYDGSARACPTPPTALLEYRFEETRWNGTPGEIIDHTGNGYNAQVNNNSILERTSPALSGNLGTCGYARQNDGSIQVTGLPLDTTTDGVKTTVTFWMNWDGTNSTMPIGWNVHDIWIVSGSMGFNTGAGDLYGISSAGLANGWHHVAVEFTNGSVTSNRIHIDGVEQVLTQRQNTPNNSRAVVDSELRIGGWSINSGYDFHGAIDEVRVYEGVLTTSEVGIIMAERHACPSTPVAEYRFDELEWDGTADEVIENLGNANNGSIIGDPATIAAGQVCRAGTFDGTGDYIDVSGIDSYLSTTASISFWMKSSQSGDNTAWRAPGIIGVEQNGGSSDIFWGYLDASGHIRVQKGNGSPAQSSTLVNDDNWHHVVLTWDSASGVVQAYVDGNLEDSANSATGDVGTAFSSIGRIENSYSTVNFDGQLDELLIFDSVVSASDVSSIYINQLNGDNYDGSTRNCPGPAIPLLEYRFEEASWDGSAGEIIDHTGNGYNAQVNNNSTPETDTPAIPITSDNLGTCGYASQNDGSIQVTGLPLDTTTNGVKTTVTFWMNWDGTNSTMPIGWNVHDIWIISGSMGFNTGAGDLYGISSAGLANGWHHVAVEFTNGSVTSNRMHIDGVEQVLTQRRNTPNNSRAVVDSELRIGGWSINGGYDFHGLIDEVRVYEGILTTAQVVTIMAETHACDTTAIHHYEISHDGQGLTCEAENVTIKACTNESCSTPNLSTELVSLDLLANGTAISSPTFTGSTTISVSNTNVETLTLSVADATLTASNPIVCDDGSGTSCDLAFDDTGFQFISNDVEGIANQLSGKPSNVGYDNKTILIKAIKKDPIEGACIDVVINQSIEFAAECINPSTCSLLLVDGTDVVTKSGSPSSYTEVDVGFNGTGTAEIVLNYPDAGALTLHARYNIPVDGVLSGDYMQGSSNSFVVRPFGFYIGVDSNPAAQDATGTKFKKAGESFSVTVTAKQWEAKDDDGIPEGVSDDGIPDSNNELKLNTTTLNFDENVDIDYSLVSPSPLIGKKGILSNKSFTGFLGGTQAQNLSWDEVGILRFDVRLADRDYLGAGDIQGNVPYVGRFIPDHFKQTITATSGSILGNEGSLTVNHNNNLSECRLIDWAYSGQLTDIDDNTQGSIRYFNPPELTITAYNLADEVTKNYRGDFAKLMFLETEPKNKISFKAPKTNHINGLTLTGVFPELGEITDLGEGVLTYKLSDKDHFVYTRNVNSKIPPFKAAFELPFKEFIDSDDVTFKASALSIDYFETPKFYQQEETPPSIPAFDNTVEIRFGRLVLENNFGPETSNLPLLMQIEHFVGGTSFVVSDDNDCVSYDADKISLSNTGTSNSLDPALTESLGGIGNFIDGKTQGIELKAPDSDDDAENQGTIKVTYDTYDWLKYDWETDGDYIDPSAIATFGIFRGNDRIIYWREVFNE